MSVRVVKTKSEMSEIVEEWREQGLSVGFVPTMGYLHEGHASLIDRSVSHNDRTVVSIFVNPIQFAPGEDLDSYPRDLEHDIALAEVHDVDVIFNPEPREMYSKGFCSAVMVEGYDRELCGVTRPTHFRGVCTVVTKLFNIVKPDRAYFGKKDAQQLIIIQRMVKDLDMGIEIYGCPIVREPDGLAKSSRNAYLNKEEREAAQILSKAIKLGIKMIRLGERDCGEIISAMKELIRCEPLAKVDYVSIVSTENMRPVKKLELDCLCAIAVYIGKTRLIDNFFIKDI